MITQQVDAGSHFNCYICQVFLFFLAGQGLGLLDGAVAEQ